MFDQRVVAVEGLTTGAVIPVGGPVVLPVVIVAGRAVGTEAAAGATALVEALGRGLRPASHRGRREGIVIGVGRCPLRRDTGRRRGCGNLSIQ
jgi:hypothetical protein